MNARKGRNHAKLVFRTVGQAFSLTILIHCQARKPDLRTRSVVLRQRACSVFILEKANQSQGWDAKPRATHVPSCTATRHVAAWSPKGCWLSSADVAQGHCDDTANSDGSEPTRGLISHTSCFLVGPSRRHAAGPSATAYQWRCGLPSRRPVIGSDYTTAPAPNRVLTLLNRSRITREIQGAGLPENRRML